MLCDTASKPDGRPCPSLYHCPHSLTDHERECIAVECDPCRVLFVAQKEWTVIGPRHAGVDYIVSDDATSCSIVVVRAAQAGVV
eukprot:23544-Eustigmatos_ZCMA.PRE.1